MVGDGPTALQPGLFHQPNAVTGSGVDDQRKDEGIMEDRDSGSTDSTLEAPVSASQIYHAALLSSSTLDDILAAFEADRDNQASGCDRVDIRHGRSARPSAASRDAMGQRKRPQCRTLSVWSTPEAVLAAGKAHDSILGRDIHSCPRDFQPPKASDPRGNACRVQIQAELQADPQIPKNSPKSHTSIHTRYPPEEQQSDAGGDSNALDRCPTFARRHAQSRLPRRSEAGDKQSLAMLKERGAASTPELTLSPPAPTRRVRLQRRVRPSKNGMKASND